MAVADKLRELQIKANIISDDQVGIMEIHTEVRSGTAVLTGEVETEEQKRIAEELAWEVDGIYEVRNEIAVVPSPAEKEEVCEKPYPLGYGPTEGDFGDTAFSLSGKYTVPGPGFPSIEQFPGQFTDEQVESEIEEKLHAQTEVDVSNVRFRSVGQMVYLSGTVPTSDDLNVLQDMVLNVRGVLGVCSDVTLQEGDLGTPTQ